jgi:hypothetical protein
MQLQRVCHDSLFGRALVAEKPSAMPLHPCFRTLDIPKPTQIFSERAGAALRQSALGNAFAELAGA